MAAPLWEITWTKTVLSLDCHDCFTVGDHMAAPLWEITWTKTVLSLDCHDCFTVGDHMAAPLWEITWIKTVLSLYCHGCSTVGDHMAAPLWEITWTKTVTSTGSGRRHMSATRTFMAFQVQWMLQLQKSCGVALSRDMGSTTSVLSNGDTKTYNPLLTSTSTETTAQ